MHYQVLIVVHPDFEDVPESEHQLVVEAAVETALEGYEHKAWDYYTMGGRWSSSLDGRDWVSFGSNPELFRSTLLKAKRAIQLKWSMVRRKLLNLPVDACDRPADLTEPLETLAESHGAVAGSTQMWVDKTNAEIRQRFAGLKNILDKADFEEALNVASYDQYYVFMEAYDMLCNNFTAATQFLWAKSTFEHYISPSEVLYYLENAPHDSTKNMVIVVMDLHY